METLHFCPKGQYFSINLEALSLEGSVGAQGRPPQNVPQRHMDYFELKLLNKQPMQERHSDLLYVSLKLGNKSLMKGALPASGGRRDTLITKDRELGPRNLYIQTL